uniref:Uncharacterized protein n=1 Tax=Magallana gigas TaxID=29159 RepID=K1QS39_MAGGI
MRHRGHGNPRGWSQLSHDDLMCVERQVRQKEWSVGIRYSLENILVICAIVGLCLLIIAIVTLISVFTSRWRYTMSREHDLEDSRYDNTIISSYEGDSSMWTTEGTFRTLEEL